MTALYGETIRMLKQVFQTRYDAFLITGSGSAGMEAAIASTIEAGDKVVGDGYFSDLVKLHGGEYFSVPETTITPNHRALTQFLDSLVALFWSA